MLENEMCFRLFFYTFLAAFRIKSIEKDSPIFSQVSIYEVDVVFTTTYPLDYQKVSWSQFIFGVP